MNALETLYVLDFDETRDYDMTTVFTDRRAAPRYSVAEVSLYLHLHEKTLRSWLFGRQYTVAGETVMSQPLIVPADPSRSRLSFYNLVECHILKSARQRDEVPMQAIRDAIEYAMDSDPSPHPLITQRFETEGSFLFVEKLGQLVNYTKQGQLAFGEIMQDALKRIDRDYIGPSVLYPFIPNRPNSKVVAIKPGVSSGVPTVSGTGISIQILFGRFNAGDSVTDLMDDYELTKEQVEDALEYLRAA